MASTTDKITDVRNSARPNSARVTVARVVAGTSLTCNSLSGWPTDSKVHFVTYQIDSNSDPIDGTQLDCSGIVSGSTIGSITVIDGTDGGNSVGDVVEMLPTAAWGQDLADALMVAHERTGELKADIVDTANIADDAVENAQIANDAVDTDQIADDAVTVSNIDWTTFPLNIKSSANSSLINPTNSSQNLSGISISFTVEDACYALVTVSLGCSSTSDFEFVPQIRLGGSVVKAFSPSAAAGNVSNRATVRGFTWAVPLVAGANVLTAGVQLSSSTAAAIQANGGAISAIVLGKVTA